MRNDLFRARSVNPGGEHHAGRAQQPYWMLLPRWLWSSFNGQKGSHRIARRFLDDVLWAQHCLFMVFRLQDDLFDGQAKRRSLIFASDLFLLESDRVFDRYFEHSPGFQTAKRAFLQQTIRGIIEADAHQSGSGAGYRSLPDAYMRVCALFKLGPFAICMKAGRMDLFRRISAFSDQMAVVGQILDDMNDIREDLNRGRQNYASAFILHFRRRPAPTRKPSLRQVATIVLRTDVVDCLFAELTGRLEMAASAIAPLRLDPSAKYLNSYRESINAMAKQIRRQRVKTLIGL